MVITKRFTLIEHQRKHKMVAKIPKKKIIYKIRNRRTGLFSKGGSHQLDSFARLYGGGWSKKGKSWNGTGPLRNHLNLYEEKGLQIPEEWDVITYEVVEEPVGKQSAREFAKGKKN